MAITTSNSNYVNISNLPKSQQVQDTDLLVIQTDNGTQTITFGDLNVVKTDIVGNATIFGNLTGNTAIFETVSAGGNVFALGFNANGNKGIYTGHGFYNKFTINGGLITSAQYVTGSYEYNDIKNNILPAVTAFQDTQYKRITDIYRDAIIPTNASTKDVILENFFIGYPGVVKSTCKPYHFYVTATERVSSCPWVDNVNNIAGAATNDLSFRINLGYIAPSNIIFRWRFLYTYPPYGG